MSLVPTGTPDLTLVVAALPVPKLVVEASIGFKMSVPIKDQTHIKKFPDSLPLRLRINLQLTALESG